MKFNSKYIKPAVEFFLNWYFKTSPLRAFGIYATLAASVVVGSSLIFKGHISENGDSSMEWSVSCGEYSWIMLGVLFLITVAYVVAVVAANRKAFLQFAKSDDRSVIFREAYIPYFTKLFELLDTANYPHWAYNLAVSGNTYIRCDRYYDLRDLLIYCSSIQHRYGFEAYERLTNNFRDALNDMLNVFSMHMNKVGDETYEFHRFYKDLGFNPDYYKDVEEFKEETLLIADLMLEVTRLLNLLLDRIRDLYPGFMAEFGNITIPDVSDKNHASNIPITFLQDEISDEPYPGLKLFLTEREKRQHRYSYSDSLLPVLRRNYLIRE